MPRSKYIYDHRERGYGVKSSFPVAQLARPVWVEISMFLKAPKILPATWRSPACGGSGSPCFCWSTRRYDAPPCAPVPAALPTQHTITPADLEMTTTLPRPAHWPITIVAGEQITFVAVPYPAAVSLLLHDLHFRPQRADRTHRCPSSPGKCCSHEHQECVKSFCCETTYRPFT